MNTRTNILTALALAGFSASVFAQPEYDKGPYVEIATGQKKAVDRIDSKPSGDLVVYISGKPVELARDKWKLTVGVRPDELDDAAQFIAEGKSAEAMMVLETVLKKARFQSWDVVAGLSLIDLQLASKDANAAASVLKSLQKRYGDDTFILFADLELADWKTRVALGKTEGLEAVLSEALAGDDRARAAKAQLIRGDVKARAGLLKTAQLDYLRTNYFYAKEDSIQPEALFKIGSTFSAMGDTSNAKIYFRKLKETYPDSNFAAKANAEE